MMNRKEKMNDKACTERKNETECLRQHERENFSSCVHFHVRPLEQKDGKTNGISLHLNCFRWFCRFMWDINSLFRCCCARRAHSNEIFILVSLLLAFFRYHFFLVLCATIQFNHENHVRPKSILFWLKCTRFVWLGNTIDMYRQEKMVLFLSCTLNAHCYRLRIIGPTRWYWLISHFFESIAMQVRITERRKNK